MGSRGGSLLPLPASHGPRWSLAGGHITPVSASAITWPSPPCVCVFASSVSYRDTCLWMGAQLHSPSSSCLRDHTYVQLQRPFLQIRSYSQGLGQEVDILFLGGYHLTCYILPRDHPDIFPPLETRGGAESCPVGPPVWKEGIIFGDL